MLKKTKEILESKLINHIVRTLEETSYPNSDLLFESLSNLQKVITSHKKYEDKNTICMYFLNSKIITKFHISNFGKYIYNNKYIFLDQYNTKTISPLKKYNNCDDFIVGYVTNLKIKYFKPNYRLNKLDRFISNYTIDDNFKIEKTLFNFF